MTLKSALEDLTRSTLRAISGCLQRLEYLSGLRERGEGYSHWGFEKLHGESAANKALAEAHSSAVSNVLSTPLSKLLSDVQSSTQAEGQNTEACRKREAGFFPTTQGRDRPGILAQCCTLSWGSRRIGERPPLAKSHSDSDHLANHFRLRCAYYLRLHWR
jgi:hypothetical protein